MQLQQKITIGLSRILGLLVVAVSLIGVLTPNFYQQETFNWQIQSVGQDYIDLALVAPALLISTQIIVRTRRTGMVLVAGASLYLIYIFLIYAFDVHFNNLFLFYCFILGLSFYLFIYFLSTLVNQSIQLKGTKTLRRLIGIYFIVISVLFYMLWLSEIIPASIANKPPASLVEVGLLTNPVHVLDLAIILPGIFITGILLLKNKNLGFILAPIILVFFFLMDVTIGTLSYLMMQKGLEGSYVITTLMAVLALLSLGMLLTYLKKSTISHESTLVAPR